MKTGQVFLSHTSDMEAFPAERSFVQAALDAVGRAGMAPVDMRYFAAREGTPAQYCQQRVRSCDIYVALIGYCYGSLVPDTTMSYTELEFTEATAAGLPRLVFLLEEGAPELVGDSDRSAVDAFRQRLGQSGVVTRSFTSSTDLELEVFHALTELNGTQVAAVPRQLPAAIPHFAGRAAELAELDRLLQDSRDSTQRTVVISAIRGTAGVGKTALAVHWAHQIANRFPDGQLYVNLRGSDASGTPVAAAEAIRGFLDALAVPAERMPAGPDAQAALYRSLLAGRNMLVLLDNARDAAQVRPLLPGTPGCLVLVTSRSRLIGLAALDGARPLTVNLLAEHEARDLLARRLGAERLNTEPAAATELIALSARLPLALNIVAALAAEPGYPLAALATDLRDERSRMDILQTEDPASSLRAVFSWSYQNLSQPAAWLFRLLSLHPGPDITIAAAASLGGLGLAQTRAVITELADANLISEQTPGRYAFHDLLRSYAAGLAAATETEADRQEAVHRALDHYLQTAYAGSVALSPARLRFLLEPPRPGVVPEPIVDSADAMAWFSAERQVLLAAAKEASELGFDRHGWQLPWAAALFFTRKGYWPDLLDSQHAAIAAARRLGDRTGQAYAWRELGWARFHLGAFNDAIDCFQQALDLHAQLGDRPGQARAHHDIAAAADKLRRFDLALRHAQESLGLCQGGDDQVAVAKALNEVGWLHAQLGQPERALAYCEQALDLVRPLDDPVNEAAILDSIGYALTHLERHTEAIERLRAAARMIEGNRAPPWAVDMLIHLGDACMAGGQRDEGYRAWADALAIMEDLQHPDAARFREEIARFRPESPGATD